MPNLHPVAGCKFYIGSAVDLPDADITAADFTSATWTEVDGWSTMGTLGDAATLITTPLINRRRDIKQKGTRNAGSMQNVFAIVPDDAGQEACIAAEKTDSNYQFRIVYTDIPTGGGTPTEHFFVGLVTSAQEAGGGANTVQNLNVTIEINSNIAVKAPVPTP